MNQLKIYLKVLLFFLKVEIILFLGCISFERGLESQLYFSSVNVAVYKMDNSPFQFSKSKKQQIKIEAGLLKNIISTIRKERSLLRIANKEPLWSSDTVDELLPILLDLISPANKDKTFFVVVKEEDKLSPYSRIFRTNFYLAREENVLNLIFGEIDNNINFGAQFSFTDWANPSFFKIECKKDKTISFFGKLEKSFRFKSDSSCADNKNLPAKDNKVNIEKPANSHWVQVDFEKAIEATLEKPLTPEKGTSKTREKRLKELFDLYKKGLINKDDYEIKKAEILGEI
jgi:hypothetical protein